MEKKQYENMGESCPHLFKFLDPLHSPTLTKHRSTWLPCS